jgi:serine phosphatase RsbU (regulator of sigma subunit)
MRLGDYDIYGLSLPSGEVGGDLVDCVGDAQQWIAYVADVSGHGVSSGVLMAMLKSATRTSLRRNDSAVMMLQDVNEVFYSLKAPNAFATFAGVRKTPNDELEILVAGHLPVLHCDGEKVNELSTPGLPVGILPDGGFQSITAPLKAGELLLVVSDGLTEVFNKEQEEIGAEYMKDILLRDCGAPLEQIASHVLRDANAHGPRSDDQTILLIRHS